MRYTIRNAASADLEAMFEIEQACIADPWSMAAFESSFAANGALFLVAEAENGEICGFVTANAVLDEISIYNIAARANPFAKLTPTRSAPIRPGA